MTDQARLLFNRALVGALLAVTTVASTVAFAAADARDKAAMFHTLTGDYLVGLHAKATVEASAADRVVDHDGNLTRIADRDVANANHELVHHYGW